MATSQGWEWGQAWHTTPGSGHTPPTHRRAIEAGSHLGCAGRSGGHRPWPQCVAMVVLRADLAATERRGLVPLPLLLDRLLTGGRWKPMGLPLLCRNPTLEPRVLT